MVLLIKLWHGLVIIIKDFIVNFPEIFKTQTLIELWITELEQRQQQPGEDVNITLKYPDHTIVILELLAMVLCSILVKIF